MEKWCAGGKEAPHSLAGMEVEIDTSLHDTDNEINEHEWVIVGGPALEVMKQFAPGYSRYYFCEHMLEMD